MGGSTRRLLPSQQRPDRTPVDNHSGLDESRNVDLGASARLGMLVGALCVQAALAVPAGARTGPRIVVKGPPATATTATTLVVTGYVSARPGKGRLPAVC